MHQTDRKRAVDRARILVEQGDIDGAVRELVQAGAMDAGIKMLAESAMYAEAGHLIMRALRVKDTRRVTAELVAKLDEPKRKRIRQAAKYLARGNEFREALPLYEALGDERATAACRERILQMRERSEQAAAQSSVSQAVDARVQAVREMEKVGDHERALQAYENLNRPADAGRVAMQLGYHQRAAKLFLKAAEPFHASRAFLAMGKPKEAMEALTKTPRTDPNYRNAAMKTIELAASGNVLDLYVENFLGRFLAKPPRDEREARAFFTVADLYRRHDHESSARKTLELLLETFPGYPNASELLEALEDGGRGSEMAYERIMREEDKFRESRRERRRMERLQNAPDLPDLPDRPARSGSQPPLQGSYPPRPGSYPPRPGSYPPRPGSYPPRPGSYPPHAAGYPPPTGAHPPTSGGYPPTGRPGSYPPMPYPPNYVPGQSIPPGAAPPYYPSGAYPHAAGPSGGYPATTGNTYPPYAPAPPPPDGAGYPSDQHTSTWNATDGRGNPVPSSPSQHPTGQAPRQRGRTSVWNTSVQSPSMMPETQRAQMMYRQTGQVPPQHPYGAYPQPPQPVHPHAQPPHHGSQHAPPAQPAAEQGKLEPGVVIQNRYRLDSKIGEGGMATVFKAYDLDLDEAIAIKVFTRELNEPELIQRFKQELSLSRKVTHPNVIRLYDMGEFYDRRFITMELLDGHDLNEYMGVPMDLGIGLSWLSQASRGLHAAHRLGVVHRDVKPHNIFICKNGTVKVMDFGIARKLSKPGMTVGNVVAGTPEYMSPEQIAGFSSVSPSTDMYALGVIAYQLFTGRLPFEHPEMVPLLMMHIQEPVPPPRSVNPKLPAALEQVILRLMAKKPEGRFPDCKTVAAIFDQLRNTLPKK